MKTQTRSAYATPPPPVPFQGAGDTALGIAMLLSLPVRVMLRRHIGLHLLKKRYLAGMTALLLLASWMGNLSLSFSLFGGLRAQSADDLSLWYFTLFVFLPLGIWQLVQRMSEEKRGVEPHTYWAGDGWWYSFVPLPDKYVDMLIDPLVAFIAGALLRYRLGCGLLGLWVMIGAFCLLLVEKTRYAQALEHRRDRRNLIKEAGWDAGFLRGGGAGQGEATPNGASIPTGNDAGLQAQIEKRRMEKLMQNPGVDNEIR
jgi:hypothetical protein